MKKRQTKTYYIPIIDCPCGQKDTPLSTEGPFVKEIDGKQVKIYVSYCPACNRVPVEETEIKGYVSEAELIAKGWLPVEATDA